MKSPYLFVALLLATLFAFQAQSLRLARNQMPLSIDTGNRNYFGRLGFNNLLEKATDSSDPTQTVANVFNYYIDGRDYFNYIQELYCQANTQGGKYITLEQYFAITDAQGVHQVDARRVSEYVRGVFGLVNNDTSTTPIDAFTFNQAAELLFAESVSVVTFSYIVQSSRHSRHVTVTADQVQEALVNIFSKFGDSLPAPNCDEIRYLFHQSDVDKDGELNLQEFHVFLAIYLRFYKYGIQNNRYAVSVMKDQIFEYVWNNEDGLGGRTERSNFLQLAFARFLQMTVYDKIQNQMSHLFFTKFDSDGSGAIDRNEFAALLDFFHAPTDEVDVLFIAADTDSSGQIDFSEFIVTLTTLLRKLTADFGYSLLTMEGAPANVDNAYAIFKDATTFLRLEILSRDTFEATFAAVDEDNNAVLSIEEFTKFLSNIIGQLRAKVRLEEEAQISAVAGLDVDEVTAEDIQSAKEEAAEQVSDIVYSDQTLNTQDAIGQVQDDNGATEEELENAAESQVGGASVEEVIQAAEQIATEQIITAVTEAAIAQATSTDCPTEEAIVQVIEQVLTDGTVDDIISTIENTSGEEIIETVTEVVHEQHPDEYPVEDDFEQLEGGDASQQVGDYVYYDSENGSDSDVEAAIDDVISSTGATETEITDAIESQIGVSSVEDVITAAQQVATEQVIDAVTTAVIEGTEDCTTEEAVQAAIEQVLTDGTIDDIVDNIESSSSTTIIENVIDVVEEGDHTEAVTEQIADETGYTEEELNDAIESQLGGGSTVEDVIEAAETVATEQVIDAVTTAVIEQAADSSDCPTEESIADAIEDVIEGGVVDDIVEQLQEASTDDIVEAVTDVVEGNDSSSSDSSDDSDSESSDGDSTAAVIEQIEDSGVSVDDIEEALEDQTGGASVEDVIEAANQVAAESVIEAVAEAVIENVPEDECVTPSSIEYVIQDAIESGVVDQVVEDIDIPAPEDVVEAVEEAASSDESDEESSEESSEESDEESSEESDESSDSSDERPNSAFIQLSGFRQFLGKN